MDIRDLSIGDWVQDANGKYAQILGIEDWSDGYILNVRINGVNVGCVLVSSAHPIPITPEILEKNGFAFLPDDNPRHLRFVDGNIVISTYEGRETFALYCYNDMGWAETFSQTLRYIHQLQHAFRLAGVGKEITL